MAAGVIQSLAMKANVEDLRRRSRKTSCQGSNLLREDLGLGAARGEA